MFLFKRGGQVVPNTGQSFRSFLQSGFGGHRATLSDWRLHLSTLFPEVRLKNTLEMRSCDSLPRDLVAAVPALLVGLFYDERALLGLEELLAPLEPEEVEAERPRLLHEGLMAPLGGRPAVELAERVLDLAGAGLERRGRMVVEEGGASVDERRWLRPLAQLVGEGQVPADRALRGIGPGPTAAELIRRTRL